MSGERKKKQINKKKRETPDIVDCQPDATATDERLPLSLCNGARSFTCPARPAARMWEKEGLNWRLLGRSFGELRRLC